MKILITGGLGYIGSYLIAKLHNCDITVVDNLYTQRYCTLFQKSKKYKFVESDFKDLSISFLKDFDIVIHLAAIVDAANSQKQKTIVEDVNFWNTQSFIYKCRQAQCKFIFPSSTSVYGTAAHTVYEDEPSFLNPQSPYAENKIKIENVIEKLTNFDYVILRLGTVCGISAGMRFQTCINKFCYQAAFKQPLTVWKQNIDMVRPYLCLSDLNNVIQNILGTWASFRNDTFNVVTNNLSVKNIIEMINHITPVTVNYTDCPLLNQYSYNVSTNKIENKNIKFFGSITKDIKRTLGLLS